MKEFYFNNVNPNNCCEDSMTKTDINAMSNMFGMTIIPTIYVCEKCNKYYVKQNEKFIGVDLEDKNIEDILI